MILKIFKKLFLKIKDGKFIFGFEKNNVKFEDVYLLL